MQQFVLALIIIMIAIFAHDTADRLDRIAAAIESKQGCGK